MFVNKITPYVYGMPEVSKAQINRLFKKEKKMKFHSVKF